MQARVMGTSAYTHHWTIDSRFRTQTLISYFCYNNLFTINSNTSTFNVFTILKIASKTKDDLYYQ